ncbi:MAG: hypothetical protein JW967_09180 [Dehalococcoidales bacterium]|nr:hypothetical protein [Dehalococcoidales bacterium]
MAEWANEDEIYCYEDAVLVVLEFINMRVDPRKILWCNYPSLAWEDNLLLDKVRHDTKKLERELEDELELSRLWYVGIPQFKLIRRDIPYLNCNIDLHYAACDASGEFPLCWTGKIIPKADTFDIPLSLISPLISVLNKGNVEPKYAHVTERGNGYAIYEYMGREWKIPDAFLGFAWALKEKGKGFEGLLDPISCSLMNKFAKELPVPPSKQPQLPSGNGGDYQTIVVGLEQMGFIKAKAEEAANYVKEKIPKETLENKMKIALKYLGS